MLAEKFVLVLETLIAHAVDAWSADYPDGSPRVVSKARHVPITLPNDPVQPAAGLSI
jgi:hypothetical protein